MYKTFLLCSVLLLSGVYTSFILRVRQPDGMLLRIQVSSNSTMSALCNEIRRTQQFQSQTQINNTAAFNLSISGSILSFDQLEQSNSTVEFYNLKSGDIVHLIRTETVSKITGIKRGQSPPSADTKTHSKSTKRSLTIADLEKRKKSLFQFKILKADRSKQLRVSKSIQRILNRISNKGGVVLLLGDLLDKEIEDTGKKSRTTLTCHDIIAATELHCGAIPNDLLSSSNCKDQIARVESIASGLGLKVLGCGVCSEKGRYWGPEHVYAGLQVMSQVQHAVHSFVILSVGNGSFESSHKKPKHSAARVPSSAAFRLASAPGKASNATIHCEAFVLSNQTLSLLDSNLLSWQRRSFAPTSTAQSKGQAETAEDKIFLEGPICLKNDEVTSIDPLLLAQPVAIVALDEASSPTSSKSKSRVQCQIESSRHPLPRFQHSFPTPSELSEISSPTGLAAAAVAKSFLTRLLKHVKPGRALDDEAKKRLLDPHLLLHLGERLGQPAVELLLSQLDPRAGNPVISVELSMIMDAMRISLESDELDDE